MRIKRRQRPPRWNMQLVRAHRVHVDSSSQMPNFIHCYKLRSSSLITQSVRCQLIIFFFLSDDWAISTLASFLNLSSEAATFAARAQNYRKLWNPDRQIMCARSCNGTMVCPTQLEEALPYPFESRLYTEGDAWQWLWFVPQDGKGLVGLFPSAQVP